MKNRIIALVVGVLLLLFSSLPAQITFERWYGGNDPDQGYSVKQTSDGGYIIVGFTYSLGAGESDVYLIKTHANGDTLWTRTYGGASLDDGYSVTQISNGGYIIAGFTRSYGAGSGDVYLIRTDTIGDTLWARTFGGPGEDRGRSVVQTSDGGYIITGVTNSYGAGFWDVYLIKTDSLGDTIWTKTYGGTVSDFGFSVAQITDGGYIIAGKTNSYGAGHEDVYLIKINPSGDTLWTRTYGGTDNDYGYSVAQTSDGGYVVAGWTYSFGAGFCDVYLIKTDSLGDTLWTRTYGGTSWDRGRSVAQTSDGGYIIAGHTESYGVGGADVYLIKTHANGDTLWTRTYGGTDYDEGYPVAQTSDGGYIIAGWTTSYGAGYPDVYLIKTDSLGMGIQEEEEQRQMTRDVRFICHPNPFTTSTVIILPSIGHIAESIELQIYGVTGRRLGEISLLPFNFSLGAKATWDGRDEAGKVLPPGIYFLKLNGTPVGKVVKVK